jgi:transposase InsO family protein
LKAAQAAKTFNRTSLPICNGPEYIRHTPLEWTEKQRIALAHLQPGQPQQNAYIARYDRTGRHEWLDQHIIKSIEKAQHFATPWHGPTTTTARTWALAASRPQ